MLVLKSHPILRIMTWFPNINGRDTPSLNEVTVPPCFLDNLAKYIFRELEGTAGVVISP